MHRLFKHQNPNRGPHPLVEDALTGTCPQKAFSMPSSTVKAENVRSNSITTHL
ncbi:hypothetical protein SLEP1_g27234 [Rubroshorea leprosula]|uniref:Uncharacterized protein n=1 Tax=Rubroshorea leprosula TaxID=152421 RepID=A0AAV5JPK6_9ROSI|nr:hypothetical protein SLEP1_g27234 [Rubroshorea leprosula]